MRISLSLATFILTSATAEGSVTTRKLSGGYHRVYDAMTDYYGDTSCNTSKKHGQTVTKCSMSGSESTFTSDGTSRSPDPKSLKKCMLGTGQTCQTWYFNGSETTSKIIDEAFGQSTLSPTASPTASPVEEYYTILETMLPFFDGACSISLSGGNTKVSCANLGYEAELNAKYTMDQEPIELTASKLLAGITSENKYYFNGAMSTVDILSEAFPNAPVSSGDYADVLEVIIPHFSGSCSIDLDQNKDQTRVSCSMPGFTANLTADGTTSQTPTELETCMLGTGSTCQTWDFTDESTSGILEEAFN